MKRSILFILFLLSFTLAILIENSEFQNLLINEDANALLSTKLDKIREKQEQVLSHADLLAMVDEFDVKSDLYKKISSQNFSLFAYKHQCLVFWSDNIIHPYNFPASNQFTKQILQNRNGWYQMISVKKGDYDLYCYYHFYRRYPFNNDYFVNAFCDHLNFNHVSILPQVDKTANNIGGYAIDQDLPLIDQSSYSEKRVRQLVEVLFIISFSFFAAFSFSLAGRKTLFNARVFVILISAFISVFNLLAFFNLILKHKTGIPLFLPELAAYSDFVPSLGHAVLLSMSALCMLVMIHQSLDYIRLSGRIRPFLSYSLISLLNWALNIFVLLVVLPKYILNSRINYDFKSLTNVNANTIVGMFNVFLLFLITILVNRILASLIQHRFEKRRFVVLHGLIGLILISMAYFGFKENGFLLICISVYGLILPFWLLFIKRLLFRHIMAVSFFTAAVFSVQFEQLNSFKEKENRKIFTNNLIAKEDIDLEIKLLNIEEDMIKSAAIDSFFYYSKNDYSELELNYKFTYFNEFNKHYEITLMRYDSSGNDITPNKLNYDYVNSLYNQSTNKSITNYFLYIKDLHYLGGYLAKYEICPGTRNIGYVFLLLIPKIKSDQYNLDYFFSQPDYNTISNNRYSYAIYQKDELIRGLGAYPYRLTDHQRYINMEDETFLQQNGYSRLLKKIDKETFVIVSLKAPTYNQIFTVFTFILLYFTGILVLVYLFIFSLLFIFTLFRSNPVLVKLNLVITKYLRVININNLYLETKIRLSFLLMSVLICSVVVYFTFQNVNKSFKEKQNENLDKKMSLIVDELEFGLRKNDERPIRNLIKHLSNTNEVDINLFFKDGTLYQTADNRIYDEGWFSPYIHPLAHYELIQRKQYSVKQLENIGLLEYQSYYNTVFDENRNLIGYVHLPYFSKSADLKNEFSSYLGSLLNMSTLLLMISLLIASYIGQNLVRPLNLMIESLTRIKVGGDNKAIEWSRNDEIGQLVEQYNIMLKKLEHSTEMLAQSEREGAWKEMAKQVAHEIKNPLTPMKLHLQHLQMSINRGDEHLKEKIVAISQILIEQIDQLSHMAEEFSSFAKMPLALPQICNIHQVLNSCIILFRSQNDLEIEYETSDEELLVYIDKDQMQRVFTNILKNAFQASPENEICHINVHVRKENDQVIVSFKDNGKGIEDSLKEKIFHPNFSTKNSGMGLGLAICKKIIEQMNGNISFESEVNKGSTFYVTLPVYKSDTLSTIKIQ